MVEADADHDGSISFEEAHWHASVAGDQRNVTYTTVDALAEDYFESHPQQLPRSIRIRELQQLANGAPVAEANAVRLLSAGADPEAQVSLENLAGQATSWRSDGKELRRHVGVANAEALSRLVA